MLLVENQQKEFTPISELKHIDSLLNTLEQKLYDVYQILPKLDSRRGLIDFGGTILRTLFGTATLTDLHSLHKTLDELKSRESDIAHSLSRQISYIKNLDSIVKINAAGIANLSNIVKDIVIQSNEHYKSFCVKQKPGIYSSRREYFLDDEGVKYRRQTGNKHQLVVPKTLTN